MELGYKKSEDSVCLEGWQDNWMRTFIKVPEFSPAEEQMVRAFVTGGNYTKLAIYFTDPKFGYKMTSDTAEFVIREFIRGNL